MEVWAAVLSAAVQGAGFPAPEPEYRFHPDRLWRFDLAWPTLKVAFEREGGTWGKSRHTTGRGYAADCHKYNAAQVMGWCVIRGTADMIKSGAALTAILAALTGRATTREVADAGND